MKTYGQKYSLYIVALLLLCALPLPGNAAKADHVQFFESIQDLPLMPGLLERPEATVLFDKPEGRIVESLAEIQDLSPENIRTYYTETLPQFGWESAGENVFMRNGETLRLTFEPAHQPIILRVTIQPR